jgi:DNA helicase-2/ATP-dependent DNA helicase PcrA
MKKLVLRKSHVNAQGRTYRIPYEQVLNQQQLRAVMHTTGPALVLAGAGTGKTRTLTYRVARLVEDGIDPASILLMTFTRKAASEMLRRSAALLDGRCERVAGGTFHAFAYACLRRFGFDAAIRDDEQSTTRPVRVLDQSDAQDVMNLVRGRFDVAALKKRFPQKGTLHDMYSATVNTSRPLVDVIAADYSQFVDYTDKITEVIQSYNAYKYGNGLVDYDDLLLYALSLTRHPEIGPILRSQYKHIMVDEYQDTNALQHAIVCGLAGEQQNVMVVGDDAQSIYAFRGADIRNIHAFPSVFSQCEIIRLEQNYRSTQQILDVCNSVIRDSPHVFDKELTSDRVNGEPPMLISAVNERQQSEFVVQQLLSMREDGVPLSDMAILVRSGFLSFDLEIELGKANISFRKFGGLRFTEAAHVKDLLAMLRLTENPRDVVSWYRLLLLLPGVGQATAQKLLDGMQGIVDPLTSDYVLQQGGKAGVSIRELAHQLQHARTIHDATTRMRAVAEALRPLLESTYDDHPKRWKDIDVVVAIGSRYVTVAEFLADIALDPPNDALDDIDPDDGEEEFVTISTIHSAKGLEWRTVFMIWANDGRIPSAKSAENEASLEEERRLLYVACTRAKERLLIVYPAIMAEWHGGDVVGRPSRFLEGVSRDQCPQFYLTEESDA